MPLRTFCVIKLPSVGTRLQLHNNCCCAVLSFSSFNHSRSQDKMLTKSNKIVVIRFTSFEIISILIENFNFYCFLLKKLEVK